MNSRLITRRQAIVTGVAASVGGLVATRFPDTLPPTYGSLLRAGDAFTYGAQRALLRGSALVREYTTADLTAFPATGTVDPAVSEKSGLGAEYGRLRDAGFADWRLTVEGLVARPASFSLSEIKRLPARTQVTRHTCEEGWTAIGQWTGVTLGTVLDAVGLLPNARFVKLTSYDDWEDSLDLLDALHPQTLLAYGMNGRDLPLAHGAPLRLRVERQLGYKSMKYLRRIVVIDEFDDGGKKGSIVNGWAWYTGI